MQIQIGKKYKLKNYISKDTYAIINGYSISKSLFFGTIHQGISTHKTYWREDGTSIEKVDANLIEEVKK